MNKHLKTLLKFSGFLLIGVLIAGALIPYVFKGKIIEFLKNDVNKSVNAIFDFHDADLSLFSSFPDVRVSIDSLSLTGVDDFDGIVLYKADKTMIDINLTSLFGDNMIPEINSISLQKPTINIVILDSLRANYMISMDSTGAAPTETKYKLLLEKYEIEDGLLTYQDNTMNLFTVLEGVTHSGKGNFTQDIFDLDTKSAIEKFSVTYEGTNYLKNVKTIFDSKINVNFPENKFTFNENKILLNELELIGDAMVQLSGDDINTDVSFKTATTSFKALLSMIPNAYTADFKDVKTSGNASFEGRINGTYNAIKNMMPVFDIKIKVDNGYVKYPALPSDIKDIFADVAIKTTRPDYKDMSIQIPQFRMKIGNDPISGKILANNLTGDQKVEGNIKGTLNLSNVKSSFPIEGLEELKGMVNCDMEFKAKMSDVNSENYSAISFAGKAEAKNIVYRSKGMPKIEVGNATAAASPQQITFDAQDMILGKSDLNLAGNISNPLAMLSTEKQIKASFTGTSSYFDLNEWMTAETSTAPAQPTTTAMPDENLIKNSNVNLNLKADKVIMNTFTLDNFALNGNLAANAIDIQTFKTTIDGSDLSLTGTMVNAYDYLFNNGILDGKLSMTSNKLDMNKFMSASTTESTSTPMAVIPVPEKVRIKIKSQIKELIYTNLNMKDFVGDLDVQNQEVALTGLKTNILGGTFAMEGLYDTKDIQKPNYAVKLDLSKFKFSEAIKAFDMLKKAAPVAEYLDGVFNTTLVMKGKLGSQMMPDLSTVDASGFIETINGSIKGFNPFGELSSKLGVKELANVTMANTKNWFEIINGTIELKEFNKVINGVDLTMHGKHGFGKDMDYNMELVIPRSLLKKNNITNVAESGLGLLEKEAGKLGLNINQGPNLFVNVKMTGNIKSPKFKITPKTSKGGTVSEGVSAGVNSAVAQAKDSLSKEIKKQEAKLRDTLQKRANEELNKAKSKAEKEGQKVIDSLKSKAKTEVINRVDSLTKGVISDSLKQKAKDVLDKKAGDEVDKIKDKLKDFNPFKKKGKG